MTARTSTDDEVKQLATILAPRPGELISYETFEEILSPLTRHDRRFLTVCQAFRRLLKTEQMLTTQIVWGKGLRVLHEFERIGTVRAGVAKGRRAVKRAVDEAEDIRVAALDAPHAEEAYHVQMVAQRLHRAMRDEQARLEKIAPAPLPAAAASPQRATLFLEAHRPRSAR